ncbi:hypothetical protein PV703_15635 [Streptomyces sp. ME01-24h]|nr:hypothetical protein [Streptomyces sp. ME01-24h]
MITATRTEIADLLDKAADVITTNGYCRSYVYDTGQAAGGTPEHECRVDIIGALNLAAGGTPRYAGTGATWPAERALADRAKAPSVVTWMDYPGNGRQQAVDLLRETAASLREES